MSKTLFDKCLVFAVGGFRFLALAFWLFTTSLSFSGFMSDHSGGVHGVGPTGTFYGSIIQRDFRKSEFLIMSKTGVLFTFDGTKEERDSRFLVFMTVKFESIGSLGTYGGVTHPIATKVIEVTTALPLDVSPDVKGYVEKFNGSEGTLSFKHYNTNLTLRFFGRNLVDKNLPSVGSYVLINTKSFTSRKPGEDTRRFTQTYRIRPDPSRMAESRSFVCPTFVATRLANLTSGSLVIYVGEFEKEFELSSVHPFFTTEDFLTCMPGNSYFGDFPLDKLFDYLLTKYNSSLTIMTETITGAHSAKDLAAALQGDSEWVRLTSITRNLRQLGQGRNALGKASVIINPLPYTNDVLGTASRLAWTNFAAWVASAFTKGPLVGLLEQVLLLRPLNMWASPENFAKHHAHGDLTDIPESPLGCVLLAPEPINFGFSCRLSQDGTINFKNSDGLLKIGVYAFKPFSSPPPAEWGDLSSSGLALGSLDLFDPTAAESGSSKVARAARPFREVDHTFLLTVTNRPTSPSFTSTMTNVRKTLEGFASPWEVRPTHHDAFTVAPLGLEHKDSLLGALWDAPTKVFSCVCRSVFIWTRTFHGVRMQVASTTVLSSRSLRGMPSPPSLPRSWGRGSRCWLWTSAL